MTIILYNKSDKTDDEKEKLLEEPPKTDANSPVHEPIDKLKLYDKKDTEQPDKIFFTGTVKNVGY